MGEGRSRIPTDPERVGRLVAAATKVQGREDRQSGVTERVEFKALPTKEKISAPDPAEISDEAKEWARTLGVRVKQLFDTYQDMPGVHYKYDTNDYLLARLSPPSKDYVSAHLNGMDGLLLRAKFEPRLLPNVQTAIEAWEAFNGGVPGDLVDDGLEVDGQALLNLRDFVSNVEVSAENSKFRDKANDILSSLNARIPELMLAAKKLK